MGFLQLHIHLSAQDLSFLLKDREKKFLFCVKFYATDCTKISGFGVTQYTYEALYFKRDL